MSDKVKLIIEIPKYYLEHPQDYTCLAECVRRGIPLDKIRAEIEALPRELPTDARNMIRKTRVLDIIDKYR